MINEYHEFRTVSVTVYAVIANCKLDLVRQSNGIKYRIQNQTQVYMIIEYTIRIFSNW